jgi:hypothetical protein
VPGQGNAEWTMQIAWRDVNWADWQRAVMKVRNSAKGDERVLIDPVRCEA